MLLTFFIDLVKLKIGPHKSYPITTITNINRDQQRDVFREKSTTAEQAEQFHIRWAPNTVCVRADPSSCNSVYRRSP